MRELRQVLLGVTATGFVLSCGVTNNFTKNNYKVTPNPLEVRGDSVAINIEGNVPAKSINAKAVITFQPYLKAADGGMVQLKTITVKGEKAKGNADVTLNSKTGGKVVYSDKVAYTPNLKRVTLMPKFMVNGANVEVPTLSKGLAEGTNTTALMVRSTDIAIMGPDDYKVELLSKSVNIYFPVDVDKFNPNFKLGKNLSNKAQIAELKKLLVKDSTFVARGISINAFASPDGELARNSNLSKGREESTFNFFKKELKKLGFAEVNDSNFSRGYSNAEDWTGFEKALVASDWADKDAMLTIVRNKGISDEDRENMLRKDFPKAWAKAKENILPGLRRSELIVLGASPMKTDAELMALYGMYDKLSDKEIYHLATITADMSKKAEVLNAYITRANNDWRAYNDLAVAQISLGSFADAQTNLDKAISASPNNGTVYANMGVMYKAKGDYANAEKYYKMAAQNGAEVNYNLGLLAIKKGNYGEAVNAFTRSGKSDFNVALANLLNGNTGACKSVIDALDPEKLEWQHYYLRAIAGARAGNTDEVVKNLTKAVSMNSEVRKMAKEDVEFLSMWNNPLFEGSIR